MKRLILFILLTCSLNIFAQKKAKDLDYYYYSVKEDPTFVAYLKAKKKFDNKKTDFKLPKSEAAVKEIEQNREKIMRNEKTYAEFLSKHGMKNSGEYANLWFNQLTALKNFVKKNPEFSSLSAKQRQDIIDKWYFSGEIK